MSQSITKNSLLYNNENQKDNYARRILKMLEYNSEQYITETKNDSIASYYPLTKTDAISSSCCIINDVEIKTDKYHVTSISVHCKSCTYSREKIHNIVDDIIGMNVDDAMIKLIDTKYIIDDPYCLMDVEMLKYQIIITLKKHQYIHSLRNIK
jgi:hypothetical protein